jgi:hypothetical protein
MGITAQPFGDARLIATLRRAAKVCDRQDLIDRSRQVDGRIRG